MAVSLEKDFYIQRRLTQDVVVDDRFLPVGSFKLEKHFEEKILFLLLRFWANLSTQLFRQPCSFP